MSGFVKFLALEIKIQQQTEVFFAVQEQRGPAVVPVEEKEAELD